MPTVLAEEVRGQSHVFMQERLWPALALRQEDLLIFSVSFCWLKVCVFLCLFMCVQFQGGVWSLNMLMCDGLMTMDVMLCTASIFNLCAISVDRYTSLRSSYMFAFTVKGIWWRWVWKVKNKSTKMLHETADTVINPSAVLDTNTCYKEENVVLKREFHHIFISFREQCNPDVLLTFCFL